MKWLITGGCGFIGTALIRWLMKEGGHSIRIVDSLAVGQREDLSTAADFVEVSAAEIPALDAGQVQLVVGDILDEALAVRAAQGMDVIVHLAANTGVAPSVENPRADCMANVIGILNYLEAARAAGVTRFVFASSGAAAGEVDPPIHEQVVPRPVSPYGASKLCGEAYCSVYFRTWGINTVALRFGNVYGPGSNHKSSAVAKFIQRSLRGEGLEIYGSGQQTRDFIFVEDLLRAVQASATRPNVGGEVFQIATSHETTVNEMLDLLMDALRSRQIRPPEVVYTSPRLGDVQRNYADTSKAGRLLGWKAEVALAEGLQRTVDWFLSR